MGDNLFSCAKGPIIQYRYNVFYKEIMVMQITDNIYLVASGKWGFSITHPLDCNVYLVKTIEGYIMIDSGVNLDPQRIIRVIESHGIKLEEIKKLLLTHWHGDHAGGASYFQQITGCEIYAPALEAQAIAEGDETATSISLGKGLMYPEDYVFEKCRVEKLEDGQSVTLGDVTLTGIALPGHSLQDMVYFGNIGGRESMFTGDCVFAAGQVLIQSVYDVSIYPYKLGMNRIAELNVESLFPGHGVFVMEGGIDHIKMAAAKFNMGLVPPQLYYFA